MKSDKFKNKLDNLFSYHPPKNSQDQAQHDAVNDACSEFAHSLAEVVSNPAELTTILRKIQEVRMLANFAVSCQREGISYRDLFETL